MTAVAPVQKTTSQGFRTSDLSAPKGHRFNSRAFLDSMSVQTSPRGFTQPFWCDIKTFPSLLLSVIGSSRQQECYTCLQLTAAPVLLHSPSLSLSSASLSSAPFFFPLSAHALFVPLLLLSHYLFPSPLQSLNKLLPVCLAQLLIT